MAKSIIDHLHHGSTAYKIIKAVCDSSETTDRLVLMNNICEALEERYGVENVNAGAEKLGLETTGKILEAIDFYFTSLRISDDNSYIGEIFS